MVLNHKNNAFALNNSQRSSSKAIVNVDAINSDHTDEEGSSDSTIEEEDDLDQALAEDDSDLDEDEKKMRKLNVKDFIKKEKRLATFGETNKR